MTDLFPETIPAAPPALDEARADAPLADRLRPRALDEVVGQEHLKVRVAPTPGARDGRARRGSAP